MKKPPGLRWAAEINECSGHGRLGRVVGVAGATATIGEGITGNKRQGHGGERQNSLFHEGASLSETRNQTWD